MSKKNIAFALVLIFVGGVSMSSCKKMRKKNKCNSCPTWDNIDASQNTFEVK